MPQVARAEHGAGLVTLRTVLLYLVGALLCSLRRAVNDQERLCREKPSVGMEEAATVPPELL